MAVPKRKISKARKNARRANDGLAGVSLSTCSRCNQPKTPHRVCGNCGYYGETKKLDVEGL
jgi:large subunit ribosomal protein L32